ncbi:hypothetical protein Cgig2_020583 [Carnegiea gigantea]|uniref:PH domain-containing protein n=1 Tax=Carnegiea gigantea TaxID=171969 RepID=A0A9Q1JW39_9CARY|nr:hypothetical protein Cgig2_020583 [Carnegiea gigantea]
MGMGVNQIGLSQTDGKMEGWLCIIRSNRFGLQNSRMRYFVLEDHHLKIYKSIPDSKDEVISASPIKSTVIDSCIRVTDEGRESIHRKVRTVAIQSFNETLFLREIEIVFYIFTLYNTGNHNDRLKLGASSSEEAARWIHSFKEAALKICPVAGINSLDCPKNMWQSFSSGRIHHSNSTDWAMGSSSRIDPTTSDVIAPSSWTIFGCQNGLRLFKEAKDREFHGKWDDHPAIMAVSVVDGTSEGIFRTVMSLGPSRSQ